MWLHMLITIGEVWRLNVHGREDEVKIVHVDKTVVQFRFKDSTYVETCGRQLFESLYVWVR